MDFKNAKELLALCQKKKLPISEVMRQREILLGETTAEIVDQRMDRVLEIMKDAAFSPIKDPVISMGGLIGGEARKLCEFHDLGKSLCGNVLGKGITYAMATLETNASMGLIVASPTAGSAGIERLASAKPMRASTAKAYTEPRQAGTRAIAAGAARSDLIELPFTP